MITHPAGVRADDEAPTCAVDEVASVRRPQGRAQIPLVAVTLVALVLNTWRLTLNGLGNEYYTAAARSMASSWHHWFFASLDQGGFISVDKPPLPLWISALSVRVFSSWSVLLPSALAGTAAVAVLWIAIRRRFGVVAATIAGLVLAVSPVSVAVNRLNLPEPWLVLLLVAAAWAVLRSIESAHALRWLALAGLFVGLGFNTKMLAAYIVLPAMALAVLFGSTRWRDRLARGAAFAAATLAASVPWLFVVDLVPASARPYVGGSTNNTVLDLVFGYNGLGRVQGSGQGGFGSSVARGGFGGGGAAGAGMSGAGGIFGGTAGPWRLLSDAVAPQIAWLLPLAVVGAIAAAWLHRRHRGRRAALALWIGWVVLHGVIFSYARGTFHAYYTALMAPAVAAVVGIGVASMVPLLRRHPAWVAAAVAGVAGTVALQLRTSVRQPGYYGWTSWFLVGTVLAATVIAVVTLARHRNGRPLLLAGAVALAGLLAAPVGWAAGETANPVMNATLPQAGPRQGAAATSFGSPSWRGNPTLAAFLRAAHTTETWDLVVGNAQQGSGLIADEGISVLAIGGFMGTDRSTTVTTMADKIDAGQVRWFQVSSGGQGGRGAPGGGVGGGVATSVLVAVQSACVPVTTASSGGALPSSLSGAIYDCAGRGAAVRAAA